MRPIARAASGGPPQIRRLDVARHRRVEGLFDVWLEPRPDGALAALGSDGPALTAKDIADLVRRSGAAGDDVRMLTADGERRASLFREVAAMLGQDVLITPAGADVRHRWLPEEPEAPRDAVAVERAGGNPVDWMVIQPPGLESSLPGWFDLVDGTVQARTGTVALALPGGLALATRADFTARRAAVARLAPGDPDLVTVAVTIRSAGFLVGDYRGTQEILTGPALAAALSALPLYGGDLRLWLTWPADPAERVRLAAALAALAEASGATVWTPPVGGTAEIIADSGDLRALDAGGAPGRWQDHQPDSDCGGAPRYLSTADGRLLPTTEVIMAGLTAAPRTSVVPTDMPTDQPAGRRPVLAADPQRPAGYGVSWLTDGLPVNTAPVELYVTAPVPPAEVLAGGIPAAELFLIGRPDLAQAAAGRRGEYLFRARVAPGGAVRVTSLDLHVPADLQHLLAQADAYLLPAGRLDRVRLLAAYSLDRASVSTLEQEFDEPAPVWLRCSGARHGVVGLPNDADRWPRARIGRCYALVPITARALPGGWLPLHREQPGVRDGHWLVELRVPPRRAIDVAATADRLGDLPLVRSRAPRLRAAGIALALPSRAYPRVTVTRRFRPTAQGWMVLPGSSAAVSLPAMLSAVPPSA
ncbi:hypothetical protein [Micromonospora sp. NPDC003241]